jgi:hypothetical protein
MRPVLNERHPLAGSMISPMPTLVAMVTHEARKDRGWVPATPRISRVADISGVVSFSRRFFRNPVGDQF